MATATPPDIPVPGGPIIPTFAPPPPQTTSSPGTTSSRSALPGSILSISRSSGAASPSSSTDPESSLSPTPTTPTFTPTPTDSQPATSGSAATDSSSAPPTSTPGISTMTSQPSSAVTSSASSSPTLVVSAASHHNRAGAIAGGVIGGVAFVVLALSALLFFLRRHNKQKTQTSVLPWSNSGGVGRKRGNVRISSTSGLAGDRSSGYGFSKRMSGAGFGMGVAGGELKGGPGDVLAHHVPTTSNAAMFTRHAHLPSASSHTHIGSHSNDDFGIFYSEEDEKNSTLQNHDSYSQHNKSIDLTETGMIPHLPMEPPSAYGYASNDRQRSRSITGHNRALALAQLDCAPATVSRSPSGASQKDPFASPAADQRRSSGGAQRRPTQRKAVPKYDEAEFSMTELSSPTSPAPNTAAPQVPVASPFDTPLQSLSRANSAEAIHSTLSHHLSTRSSNPSLNTPLPALNHKTSFGDMRPVHYLIPDLPPPQRD